MYIKTSTPIKVLLVDDHPLWREGVAAALVDRDDMTLVAEATTVRDAIAQFREHRPDVTLMDLQLPDGNGERAIQRILHDYAKAHIIVLTTFKWNVQAIRLLKAGVRGYLLKSVPGEELLHAIRQVHHGGRYLLAEMTYAIARHVTDNALTAREIEVIAHVANGHSNKQISDLMSISEETVKSHISNILSKLDANDRAHAVMLALRRGIIDLEDCDNPYAGANRGR
jgi:DNA-binding NarL/FixJ family response regulator